MYFTIHQKAGEKPTQMNTSQGGKVALIWRVIQDRKSKNNRTVGLRTGTREHLQGYEYASKATKVQHQQIRPAQYVDKVRGVLKQDDNFVTSFPKTESITQENKNFQLHKKNVHAA